MPATDYSGQPATPIDLKNTGLSVGDIDGNNGSDTLPISVTTGTLTATVGNSGAGVAGTGTNQLTITGTTTQINDFLNASSSTLSFVSNLPAQLSLLIHDNGNTGGVDQSALAQVDIVIGVAPVIANAGQSVPYTEQQAGVVIDNDLDISDTDAPAFPASQVNSATVSISAGFFAGDFLNFTNTATITGSYNTGTGLLTLTGAATQDDYETALHSITFSSTSDNPTNFGIDTSRTITWAVKDTLNIESSPVTSTVTVTAVNDTPAVDLNGAGGGTDATLSYTENNGRPRWRRREPLPTPIRRLQQVAR